MHACALPVRRNQAAIPMAAGGSLCPGLPYIPTWLGSSMRACACACGHRAEGLRVQPQTSDAYTTVLQPALALRAYSQTNWALRGLVHSWAQEHGVPVPPELLAAQPPTLPPAEEGTAAAGPSTSAGGVQSHPITLEEALRAAEAEPSSTPQHIPESWTFFQGVAYGPLQPDLQSIMVLSGFFTEKHPVYFCNRTLSPCRLELMGGGLLPPPRRL